jgi:ribosomal protein L29
MEKGFEYYKELFQKYKTQLEDSTSKNDMMQDLEDLKLELFELKAKLA